MYRSPELTFAKTLKFGLLMSSTSEPESQRYTNTTGHVELVLSLLQLPYPKHPQNMEISQVLSSSERPMRKLTLRSKIYKRSVLYACVLSTEL